MEKSEFLILILVILLFLFGIFIACQIILKIAGKSWQTENLVISLLIFNLGAVFTTVIMLVTLLSAHKNLERRFSCLSRDFKEHIKQS
jgi:peptidoglycan biosynthesis protein MviN/MurJ (putative lipid II flippase)